MSLSKHFNTASVVCFSGGADCWRPEWSDSYLGSEDGPQWTAESWARGLGKLSSHWPRCQLHGSSQQLGQSPNNLQRVLFIDTLLSYTKWLKGPPLALLSSRETVMCGTLLEASEKRWLSSFPRLRSLHTNATPSAASLALILRECSSLHTIKLSPLVNSQIKMYCS